MKEVIFGPPGTGKTTTLLERLGKELTDGVNVSDIAFITFTKSAAREFTSRAINRYGINPQDAVNFGTLHSLCYNLLGLRRENVIRPDDKARFCRALNIPYVSESNIPPEDVDAFFNYGRAPGNQLFRFCDILRERTCQRLTDIPEGVFADIWVKVRPELVDSGLEDGHNAIDLKTARRFTWMWEVFKQQHNKLDFTDFLIEVYHQNLMIYPRVMLVDEFQDFSHLQYCVYKRWAEACLRDGGNVYVCGDDDQCIYSFQGATPAFLLLEKDSADKVTILDHTYRVPANILVRALNLIQRNKLRVEKTYYANAGGEVNEIDYIRPEDVLPYIRNVPTYLLFRTNRQMFQFYNRFIELGIPCRLTRSIGHWTDSFIDIVNAVTGILNGSNVSEDELRALICAMPARPFLSVGVKTKAMKGYKVSIQGAFAPAFYKLKTRQAFADILNISDRQKEILSAYYGGKIGEINIRLGTIHSVKGCENDDVFVFKGVPKIVAESMYRDMYSIEEERRIFYVGMTRARKRLVLVDDLRYENFYI